MNINLAGLLRQAANAVDPKRDHGAYAFALREVADHLDGVSRGEHTLADFAECYGLRRPVRQPDYAALGLGSAEEAEGRN